MTPEPTPEPAAPPPRRSLSWRLVWFTLAVMAGTELLLFLPAMLRERQKWLDDRIVAAQIAVRAMPTMPIPPPQGLATMPGEFDRGIREDLLRLAGVMSVRLQEPGRPMMVLAPVGQFHVPALLDLRRETLWSSITATLASLTRSGNELLLVVAPSPKRPQSILSIVLREDDLDAHLKATAASIALHGLAVAVPTGVLVHFALLLLLVRPMRRLTDSIATFRADPERAAPLATPRAGHTNDEMAVAQHELAAMQRELRAALWRNARLAALGAAVAKVSHDLRGILAPALLNAERLQDNADPALRRIGDSIASTVERATGLMRTTLEFAGEVPAAPDGRVVLRDLVHEVADEIRPRHPHFHVRVAIDGAATVIGDRASLRRAMTNLIRNAAEARAKAVTVSATREGNIAVITLADDGPGLPDVVREHLFDPFITSGKPGGTGLGLAITRDLVRAQGGDIALADTSPEGTTFRLALRFAA